MLGIEAIEKNEILIKEMIKQKILVVVDKMLSECYHH